MMHIAFILVNLLKQNKRKRNGLQVEKGKKWPLNPDLIYPSFYLKVSSLWLVQLLNVNSLCCLAF